MEELLSEETVNIRVVEHRLASLVCSTGLVVLKLVL